jgi:phosphoribosyl-ATP pyrophosphohydrolase
VSRTSPNFSGEAVRYIRLTFGARLPMYRAMSDSLARLESTVIARKAADPGSSYVASLFARGTPKIAQKLGEEAVEAVIAAMAGDRAGLVGEAADLLFHLTVLLADAEIPVAEVMAELDRREGVSGLAEKAARPKG